MYLPYPPSLCTPITSVITFAKSFPGLAICREGRSQREGLGDRTIGLRLGLGLGLELARLRSRRTIGFILGGGGGFVLEFM